MSIFVLLLLHSLLLLQNSHVTTTPTSSQRRGRRDGYFDYQRVAGGRPCRIDDYPFLVQVYSFMVDNSALICGGTLLSLQWVLTAAHCTYTMQTIHRTDIIAATTKAYMAHLNDETHEYVKRPADEVVVHPEYTKIGRVRAIKRMRYDIG